MRRTVLSPMHGPLTRSNSGATQASADIAYIALVAEGMKNHPEEHGLPVPRSVLRKPMDTYIVFIPLDEKYSHIAAAYTMEKPRNYMTQDGNRAVVRTLADSPLQAITGVMAQGGGRKHCKRKAPLEYYFDKGFDVIKASDLRAVPENE